MVRREAGWVVVGGSWWSRRGARRSPSPSGDRWSDGQVLVELWLSRRPPWVRGAWVATLSGGLLAAGAWGAWSSAVPLPLALLFGLMGLLGAVGGVDLWIRGLKRRG